MRLPLFIAQRYLFSNKKRTIINIISWISLTSIAIGTTALIVVLSVYNGIGELTQSLFNVFDPELKIECVEGKTFHTSAIDYDGITTLPGVKRVCQVVEENAWMTHRENESIVQLRGVDDQYGSMTGLDTMVYEGSYLLHEGDLDFLLFGAELYYNMGINAYTNQPVAIHIPKRGGGIGMTMNDAFNSCYAYPAGNFYTQQDIDSRYVIAPIRLVRELMDYTPDEVTSLSVALDNEKSVKRIKQQLQTLLGEEYTVKDRFEQQPLYYKIFHSERLGVFLILSLIILIATLNLIASLSLLIIDKRKDIQTMKSMGMEDKTIRSTFFSEGMMIGVIGAVAGLVIGFVICWLQQHYGIVKMGGGNLIVNAFPVAMRLSDFVATFVMVMLLTALSVLFTVRHAKLDSKQ